MSASDGGGAASLGDSRGHLDLLILAVLEEGPSHGYAIIATLRARSGGAFNLPEGTVYPALHRLEAQGSIASEWGASDNNRRAKFYRLTAAGRRRLAAETETWERFSEAIGLILQNT